METAEKIVVGLFSLFLLFCAGVHVYGLFVPFNSESTASHTIHLLSYLLCLYSFHNKSSYGKWMYLAGMIYPVAFHAVCAYSTYIHQHRLNGICVLVVVALPLAWLWMISGNRKVN